MTEALKRLAYPLAIESQHAECLTDIFRDDVNMAIWRRSPNPHWEEFAGALFSQADNLERSVSLMPGEPANALLPDWASGLRGAAPWLADVNHLIDMFCCLFEPDAVGVRLHAVKNPLCPRFHTDRVPVRLLCTYSGPGTEWLPEHSVIRPSQAGPLPDQHIDAADIRHVPAGAVALLKGEASVGNEMRGLVHRSPFVSQQPRLMVGLDWLSNN